MLSARVGQQALVPLAAQGRLFYEMGGGVLRFVTSFQTTDDEVDEALRRVEHALNPG